MKTFSGRRAGSQVTTVLPHKAFEDRTKLIASLRPVARGGAKEVGWGGQGPSEILEIRKQFYQRYHDSDDNENIICERNTED